MPASSRSPAPKKPPVPKATGVKRRIRSAPDATTAKARPETRSAAILLAVEKDILAGKRRPGDHLNEQDIADRFKVSRTPVREAMRQLAAAGLVQISPRKGVFVARISVKKLLELFELMTELEALSAAMAARRARPEQKKALEALHLKTKRLTRAPADAEAYFEESSGFHRLIFEASQNAELAELASQMYTRLLPYRRRQLGVTLRPGESYLEHDAVLRAILAGDADAAAAAMRAHSGVVRGNVLDVFSALLED
jgi:DNA-binding GntR family transcriptional regulator